MLSNFRYVHAENKKTRYKPCILVFSRPIEKGKRLSQKLETQTFHMNILSYQSVAWIGCHSMNDSGGSSPRSISIGQLNVLLRLHLRPIKLVVCKWPYSFWMMGYLILKYVSRLDAFSVYQNRTQLPSCAPGGTTGAPEVRPTRSSRTKVSPSQISNAHDR